MTTIETYYADRGDSAAREDIRNGTACPVEDIDDGMVLQHLGLMSASSVRARKE